MPAPLADRTVSSVIRVPASSIDTLIVVVTPVPSSGLTEIV
jgi:hypothetical protein